MTQNLIEITKKSFTESQYVTKPTRVCDELEIYLNNVFEKELSEDIITFDDNLKDAELEKCLNINPTFTTEKVMYALESRTNISIRRKCHE